MKSVKLASVSIVPIVALPVVVIEPALPSKVIVVLALEFFSVKSPPFTVVPDKSA